MPRIAKLNQEILKSFLEKKLPSLAVPEEYLKANNLHDYYMLLKGVVPRSYSQKNKDLHSLIEILNDIEGRTGRPYLAIKSFLSYPFIDDDLDIVVLSGSCHDYADHLRKYGFHYLRNISNLREPFKKMYAHPDCSIRIHLHSEIAWNGIICLNKNEVFKASIAKRLENAFVRIPSDTDSLAITIAHFLFENYYFKIGDLLDTANLLKKNIDLKHLLKTAHFYGYEKGVYLFFSYICGLSDLYSLGLNIPRLFSRPATVNTRVVFPYYVPYSSLIPTYLENFCTAIKREKASLPRRLFTYTFVGYIWKYLLPQKRRKKLEKLLFRSLG